MIKKVAAAVILLSPMLFPMAAGANDAVCPPGWEAVRIDRLTLPGEIERAEEVNDRTDPRREKRAVCRKQVPGQGNTGEGSNIKDDLPRQ